MTEVELAWAAGFFDGEGTTGVLGRSRRSYLGLQVAQVDPRPLERFQRAVGVGKVNGPYVRAKKNHRPSYKWSASGKQAGPALSALWPYLSEPKKQQALASFRRLKETNGDFEDRRRKEAKSGRWSS